MHVLKLMFHTSLQILTLTFFKSYSVIFPEHYGVIWMYLLWLSTQLSLILVSLTSWQCPVQKEAFSDQSWQVHY